MIRIFTSFSSTWVRPPSDAGAADPYAVISESDLHAVIRAGILKEVHKSFVIYQLLKSLKYMHSASVLHRDIKVSKKGATYGFSLLTFRLAK